MKRLLKILTFCSFLAILFLIFEILDSELINDVNFKYISNSLDSKVKLITGKKIFSFFLFWDTFNINSLGKRKQLGAYTMFGVLLHRKHYRFCFGQVRVF